MMSKGKTTAQNMTDTISVESILIPGESNWIQLLLHVKWVKGETGEGVLVS